MSYTAFIRSHLVERAATDNPAFRKWFRNSKVVDASGKPLVVYHGRASDFDQFRPGPNSRYGHGQQLPGMYFSPFPGTASAYARSAANNAGQWIGNDHYGENVVPVYLSLQNPKVYSNTEDFISADRQSLIASGHDGAMRYAADTGDLVEIVAFRPEQIKSVFAQRFNPTSPRLSEAASMPTELYHGTSVSRYRDIYAENALRSENHEAVSFTSNHEVARRFALWAARRDGDESGVIIAVDAARLNAAYPLQPHSDDGVIDSEHEWRTATMEVANLSSFTTDVDTNVSW